MKIWDAEFLSVKKAASGVVTDGLIFWLDGRDELIGDVEYKPTIYSDSHMYDRINGTTITFARRASSGGMQSLSPFLYAAAPYGNGGQIAKIPEITGVKCFEVVIKNGIAQYFSGAGNRIAESTGRLFFPEVNSTTAAKVESANVIKDTPVHLVFQGNTTNGSPVIYQNCAIASVTGSSAPVVSAFSFTDLATIPQYKYLGCVRLYNRFLTDKEIAQNYAYEQSLGRVD